MERTPHTSRSRLGIALPLVVAAIAACSGASPTVSPGTSASPTGVSTPGPSLSKPLEHATGPTDVVLRVEIAGGFIAPGFLVTEAPQFTLYGDRTVIFRDPAAPQPEPVGNVRPAPPFSTAKLTEDQVQTLLQFAVGPGGLAVARARYEAGNVADAPTTTFAISAGGTRKTVEVGALGLSTPTTPDAPILVALAGLRDRLLTLGDEVAGAHVWAPDRYRGVLTENAAAAPIAWPWKTFGPEGFIPPSDPNRPTLPIRVLSAAEVAELHLSGIEGGFQALPLRTADGRMYNLGLRPLLPDEKS